MKKIIICIIIFSSFNAFASSQAKMQKVMHTYLHSIKTANKVKLQEVVSKKYYELLNKENQLEELFKQQSKDNKKITFDLKFQKYHNKENHFLVNIKDKSKEEYDHYWYVIVLKDGKYKILKEEYLD